MFFLDALASLDSKLLKWASNLPFSASASTSLSDFFQWNPNEWWMNGPSQEIALAMVGLLYKVKDAIVKIAFVDNEEINEYLWNKTRQGQS